MHATSWPALGRKPLPETDPDAINVRGTTMYDIFTAILLADQLSRRYYPEKRRLDLQPEPDSPWSRVFAWHRRNTCQ
jgi:hypothetical protein